MHNCPLCQSRLPQTNTYQLNLDECYRCGTELDTENKTATEPAYLDYLEDPRDTDPVEHFDLDDVASEYQEPSSYNTVIQRNGNTRSPASI